MKTLNKIYRFLDGRKATIGAVAGVVLVWAIARGYIEKDTATMLSSVLTIWTGMAVGHKVVKKQL